jgi:hypothetical protein
MTEPKPTAKPKPNTKPRSPNEPAPSAEPQIPTEEANPFLEELRHTIGQSAYVSQRFAVGDVNIEQQLRRFVGILDYLMPDGRRKIYTSSLLDEGVEIFDSAIRFYRHLPPSKEDGLEYDVVWVDADTDIIYFTRRRKPNRDPEGGGFPPPPPQNRPPGL